MKNLENCKRVGILGGTFNPVHLGHLFMAEYAREAIGLDAIMFIPAGVPYMKTTKDVLPGEIRMAMLDLSIRDNNFFISSDMELKREGNTYTYETLTSLKKEYPDIEFFFIVGADCLFSIENWKEPEKIFEQCTLVAASRNHALENDLKSKKLELEDKFHAKVILLDFPTIDISSTEIRKRVKEGKSIRYMVPDTVLEYIQDMQLYKNEMTEV